MRWMGRFFRRVLVALSLLLFVAVVVGWVLGYLKPGRIYVDRA